MLLESKDAEATLVQLLWFVEALKHDFHQVKTSEVINKPTHKALNLFFDYLRHEYLLSTLVFGQDIRVFLEKEQELEDFFVEDSADYVKFSYNSIPINIDTRLAQCIIFLHGKQAIIVDNIFYCNI